MESATKYCSVLQCVAVCCSVLQCVAVCCRVFQCVALSCNVFCYSIPSIRLTAPPDTLQHLNRKRSKVLQRVAVYCSVLQRVAACCSVLQCVAACCTARYCNDNTPKSSIYVVYSADFHNAQTSQHRNLILEAVCVQIQIHPIP